MSKLFRNVPSEGVWLLFLVLVFLSGSGRSGALRSLLPSPTEIRVETF